MPQYEIPNYKMEIELPVGMKVDGTLYKDAEVRAVTGADEMYIGMSREYNEHPNDMVYKMLLLGRCVTRIGPNTIVTPSDVQQLHARDIRALEYGIYALTYGTDALPEEDDGPGG